MIGFRTDLSRTIAPQLIFQREAARTVPEVRTAHYFSIRNLPVRLSKNHFPPFGRCGCTRIMIAPKPANVDYCARPPYKFRSLQGVLSVAGSG